MGMNEKWKQSMVDGATELLGEPVLAAGMFSRPGSTKIAALGPLSPLLSLFLSGKGKRLSGGLPHDFVIAVTETKIYALEQKQSGLKVKVTGQLASWDRGTLTITGAKNTYVFAPAGGQQITIESKRGNNRYNGDVIALFSGTTATTGAPVAV